MIRHKQYLMKSIKPLKQIQELLIEQRGKIKIRKSTALPSKLRYKEKTAENITDTCNLWQEYYSDIACEQHCQGKFDDNLNNYTNEIVENIDNNLNYQEKPFAEQDAITVEEIKHHIEKHSKGKAP